MRRYLILVLSVVVLISGCEAIPWLGLMFLVNPDRTETGSAKLIPFTSEQEFLDYFTDQVGRGGDGFRDFGLVGAPGEAVLDLDTAAPEDGGMSDAAPPPIASDGQDDASDGTLFSETTTQEVGVAEADVVKTDGTYLYIISDQTLRIVQAMPTDALQIVNQVSLEGVGREIYLYDQKVIALTDLYGGYYYLDDGIILEDVAVDRDQVVVEEPLAPQFDRPKTIVTVIDVSTPAQSQVLSKTKFDGTLSSSRMIDGVLYMVVSNYQQYFVSVLPMLGGLAPDSGGVTADTVLPTYERTEGDGEPATGTVVTWENMYHPEDPDGFGVVSVISLDVDNDAQFTAVGITAEPGLIYSSREALYLTDTDGGFWGDTRLTTDIYKFAYSNRSAAPVASGSVPGRILNQYSMGEHDGYLRVATTIPAGWTFIGQSFTEEFIESTNGVYVLGQTGDELTIVGSVEGIAPRETIQAARFMGDRGYVVTFEQMDPLFTLDLSEPTNPKVVGELEVPGFSTFIVPMDENHLLTVGRYIPPPGEFGPWAVQLSIYDISDFAKPSTLYNLIIGQDGGADSEALWDPKAFTYFAQNDVLALPVSIYTDSWLNTPQPGPEPIEEFMDDVGGEQGESEPGQESEGSESTELPDETEPIPPVEPGVDEEELVEFVPDWFQGLMVFQVSIETGFTELGRISTEFDGGYWTSFTRGKFIVDPDTAATNIFAVTNSGIRGGTVAPSIETSFELAFPGNGFDFADAPEPVDTPVPVDTQEPVDTQTGADAGSPVDDQ